MQNQSIQLLKREQVWASDKLFQIQTLCTPIKPFKFLPNSEFMVVQPRQTIVLVSLSASICYQEDMNQNLIHISELHKDVSETPQQNFPSFFPPPFFITSFTCELCCSPDSPHHPNYTMLCRDLEQRKELYRIIGISSHVQCLFYKLGIVF